MAVSKETFAEQTKEQRFKLAALVESGLTEDQALTQLLPNDSNRRRKFNTWKKQGLWPIPPEERRPLVGGPSRNNTPEGYSQSLSEEKLSTEEKPQMAQLHELLPVIVREVLAEAKKQEQAESFRNEPQLAENVRCIPLQADGFPVLLPPPRMDGKKCVDPRTKLGGTVLDARLAKLLEEHRLSRGVQLSRIFDTALWYYLGQPELGEGEQTEEQTADTEETKQAV
jgi:hypothetical protein